MEITKAQKGGIISVCIGVILIITVVITSLWYSGYKTDMFEQCLFEVATLIEQEPDGIITEKLARQFCVEFSEAYLFKRDFDVLGNSLEYDHSVRLYVPK